MFFRIFKLYKILILVIILEIFIISNKKMNNLITKHPNRTFNNKAKINTFH